MERKFKYYHNGEILEFTENTMKNGKNDYINVSTGRAHSIDKVLSVFGDVHDLDPSLPHFKYVGTEDSVESFLDLNEIHKVYPKNIFDNRHAILSPVDEPYHNEIKIELPEGFNPNLKSKPKNDPISRVIEYGSTYINHMLHRPPKKEETCKLNVSGSTFPKYKNVHDLQLNEIDQMCHFHFYGIKSPFKVLHVVDGDTLDGALEITLSELTEIRKYGKRPIREQVTVLTSNQDTKFIIRAKIRLIAYDGAEHDTLEGQIIKYLLEDVIKRCHNNIYIKCELSTLNHSGMDKYGRILGSIYFDKECTKSITDKIVGKKYGEFGVIALPYSGDTKSEYMKNLPKMS